MTINIDRLKEFGIGTWFMYMSHGVYIIVSKRNVASSIIEATVLTILVFYIVACLAIGTYLIYRGMLPNYGGDE